MPKRAHRDVVDDFLQSPPDGGQQTSRDRLELDFCHTTWPDPDGNEWEVTTGWKIVGDAAECVHVAFTAKDGATPVSSQLWRARLGDLLDQHRKKRFEELRESWFDYLEIGGEKIDKRSSKRWFDLGGRPLTTEETLQAMATVYSHAVSIGRRDPTRAVAKVFDISPEAAADRMRRARGAGLLAAHPHQTRTEAP